MTTAAETKTNGVASGCLKFFTGAPALYVYALMFTLAIGIRSAIGVNNHSGKGIPPMYGDYEAQRHWMEVTVNLPIQDWYFNTTDNDLQYWGLDYPPLTAFHSYGIGRILQVIEPEMVALHTSRGTETALSCVLMRLTVLVSDVAIYFPAVLLAAWGMRRRATPPQDTQVLTMVLLLLLQPALILIDHGHFQYNCVSLGLCLLAMTAMLQDYMVAACVLFTLALGFKQIALYYALCFFFYMLGWALFNGKSLGIKVLRLGLLGLSVIGTFALLFGPFLRAQPEGWQSLTQIQQILHRVFPFDRGLYEDKVANFWCVTNLLIKWRTIFSQDQLKLLTTVLTFGCGTLASSTLLSAQRRKHLFWEVLSVVSLSFFLFGYQVHEKSILYPLLPIVFLYPRYPTVTVTFGLLATLSMFPLLERDGLGQVYAVAQIAYVFLAWLLSQEWKTTSRVFFSLCVLAVVGTHICASTIPHMAPVVVGKYPDIGTYLYVLCSGLYFHVIWVYLCLQVFLQVVSGKKKQKQKQKQKHKRKKKKK